jgi:hypothetical protein
MAADSEKVAAGLNWHDIAAQTTAIYDKLITERANNQFKHDQQEGY